MEKSSEIFSILNSHESYLELLRNMAERWLTNTGRWFQAIEKEYGVEAAKKIETAIKLDASGWEKFQVFEAAKITELLNLPKDGGIPALREALGLRIYAFINKQEIIDVDENKIILRLNKCHAQIAREKNNLPYFPCKPVGFVEYSSFAKAIDPRIKTRCIACPPDEHPDEYYCAWEFWI